MLPTFVRNVFLLLIATSMMAVMPGPAAAADRGVKSDTITITVKASPASEFPSILTIQAPKLLSVILEAKPQPARPADSLTRIDDTEITVASDGMGTVLYGIIASGDLYDEAGNRTFVLPTKARARLLGYVQKLRAEHYGESLTWETADKRLPRKSMFSVIDLETGLQFQAQRRAGSNHADVQPLTKQDTAIMKQIYSGKWSWNRKAVLIRGNGMRIAASMHGMPHGGDGIPDNNFSGHFCIHFLGSTTHGSDSLDLAHQTMVHKAAGRLTDYVRTLTPQHIVDLFLLAINQKDRSLLNKTISPELKESPDWLNPASPEIAMLRRTSDFPDISYDHREQADIPVQATLYRQDRGNQPVRLQFSLVKRPFDGAWNIISISSD